MVQKSPRFLTTSFNPPAREFPIKYSKEEQEEEEFDECDVVWSSSSSFPEEETTTISAGKTPATSISSTTGLSAALLSSNEPQSPTSFQRKTTSSPVSMISSSLSRDDGPGLGGYYYGKKFHQSAPVNVPVWPNGLGNGKNRPFVGLGRFDEVDDLLDDDDEEKEMVPPHEIVARSHKATSFSVMEGAGRTLKGRDLTAVRNAVFQKTGFLD